MIDESRNPSERQPAAAARAPAEMPSPAAAHDAPEPAIVTAGLLVIGDEILSGRTKDQNIEHIARAMTAIGIDLKEVRVVEDAVAAIVAALDELRARHDYVFTTGGIGPTHDDVTADSVAQAFGVPLDHDPHVAAALKERLGVAELNPARLRMARIPRGAEVIANRISVAPGFWIGNVIVLAGVPAIMQAMLDEVTPRLRAGARLMAETIRADLREGDIGSELGVIAKAFPEVMIGSYPFMDEERGPNTNVVLRARDPEQLAAATREVERMLVAVRAALTGSDPA